MHMTLRVAFSCLLVAGCSHVSTVTAPSFPDGATNDKSASIPQAVVNVSSHSEPKCDHDVRIVNDDQLAEGYQVVSETTVSCPPGQIIHGAMPSCDERLRNRACAVGADIVLVKAHDQSASEITARLVKLPK